MLEHIYQGIIIEEISKIPGIKMGSRYSMILCPYHNERTPSGRIRHDPNKPGFGRFRCYGCSKSASWNELAATLGLRQVGRNAVKVTEADVPTTSVHRYEDTLFVENDSPSIDDLKFFSLLGNRAQEAGLTSEWRGYPLTFLTDVIGAKLAYHVERERYYVFLPVYIKGKLEGFINAQLRKPTNSKKIPSYLNAPGPWSLSKGLFPFDSAIKLMRDRELKTIVLVEGPRDALRLIKMGIPALSILGTHSWSTSKIRLLEFAGVERVVLLMDGDKAGANATKLIKTGIDAYGNRMDFKPLKEVFEVKTVKLWTMEIEDGFKEDKYDPGNCPRWILEYVRDSLLV